MASGILQVVTDTDRRGAQVFGVELGRALSARGHDVRTLALAPGAAGGLDLPTLGATAMAPATLRALRKAVREAGVVVAHGSTTLPACALATAGTGVPLVYRSIGDPRFWAASAARRLRVRLYYRRVARVVALWAGSARAIAGWFHVDPGRVTVIPNGVAAERWPLVDAQRRAAARGVLGLPAGAPVVACIGALSPEKRADRALRAVAGVEGAHLVLAGDGAERAALQALADRLLPGRAHLLGSVPDPAGVVAAADLVVLTSASEGMPAVLIEAGMSGVAAVATTVGAVAEVVVHDRTGLLVPPDDDDALRAALVAGLERAPALGAAARAHCLAHFELEVVAEAWSRVLTETGAPA